MVSSESRASNSEPRLHIGTSGWSYPDWKGGFYPNEVPQRKFLDHYATRFSATELNASFYRLPSEKMIDGWLERAPADFRFCVKLSRLVTHQKRLNEPDDALTVFLERFRGLRSRMGPVLAQLPPSLAFEVERVDKFLKTWRRRTRLPLAVEARHKSWFDDQAQTLLAKRNVALVRADSGGRWPCTDAVTADLVYLRYHGPGELYASGYTPQKLAAEADRLAGWLDEGLDVWAFFNNTDGPHAWQNAMKLEESLQRRL